MNGRIRRFAPPVLAACILLFPLHDLALRLGTMSAAETGAPGESGPPVRERPLPDPVRYDALHLPGTVLEGREGADGGSYIIGAAPREAALLLYTLGTGNLARTLALERSGSGWIARVDLYRHGYSEGLDGSESLPRIPHPSLLGEALTIPIGAETTAPPAPSGDHHSFGMVRFYSGMRMSWRWNRDTLFLEEIP